MDTILDLNIEYLWVLTDEQFAFWDILVIYNALVINEHLAHGVIFRIFQNGWQTAESWWKIPFKATAVIVQMIQNQFGLAWANGRWIFTQCAIFILCPEVVARSRVLLKLQGLIQLSVPFWLVKFCSFRILKSKSKSAMQVGLRRFTFAQLLC